MHDFQLAYNTFSDFLLGFDMDDLILLIDRDRTIRVK